MNRSFIALLAQNRNKGECVNRRSFLTSSAALAAAGYRDFSIYSWLDEVLV
jgi:hypothetical protein